MTAQLETELGVTVSNMNSLVQEIGGIKRVFISDGLHLNALDDGVVIKKLRV